MHFSTFSAGFALLTCRFDSLLWKIIPVLLDSGNKVEFFRLTQTSFFVRRKNSTLFPSSSKSGIIFHSALSNLQVRNAKRTEKVEKCISLELLFFSHWEKIFSDAKLPRKYHYPTFAYILWSLEPFSLLPKLLINTPRIFSDWDPWEKFFFLTPQRKSEKKNFSHRSQ